MLQMYVPVGMCALGGDRTPMVAVDTFACELNRPEPAASIFAIASATETIRFQCKVNAVMSRAGDVVAKGRAVLCATGYRPSSDSFRTLSNQRSIAAAGAGACLYNTTCYKSVEPSRGCSLLRAQFRDSSCPVHKLSLPPAATIFTHGT